MQLALRELHAISRNARLWVGMAVVAVLLAIAAPFNTASELTFAPRLAYWAAICAFTYPVASFFSMLVAIWLQNRGLPTIGSWVLGGLAAGLPVFGIVSFINVVIVGFSAVHAPILPVFFAQVAGISVAVALLHFLFESSREKAPANDAPNLLQQRLPIEKRGPVQRIETQDHYLEVTTTRGRELILMRMGDAIAALADVDGLQVHRSHWVARDAVAGLERRDGRNVIVMQDGTTVPVSRTHMAAVREAFA